MAAPGPPPVRQTLVVGDHAVPVVKVWETSEDGAFVHRTMVDLSRGKGAASPWQWLWKPLGLNYNDWRAGQQLKLPLMQEIQAALAALRLKRRRDGKFIDDKEKVLPSLLPLKIRGRELVATNNKVKLQLNLADSQKLMEWFLAEL